MRKFIVILLACVILSVSGCVTFSQGGDSRLERFQNAYQSFKNAYEITDESQVPNNSVSPKFIANNGWYDVDIEGRTLDQVLADCNNIGQIIALCTALDCDVRGYSVDNIIISPEQYYQTRKSGDCRDAAIFPAGLLVQMGLKPVLMMVIDEDEPFSAHYICIVRLNDCYYTMGLNSPDYREFDSLKSLTRYFKMQYGCQVSSRRTGECMIFRPDHPELKKLIRSRIDTLNVYKVFNIDF